MKFINNTFSTDPAYNLALEEAVFTKLPPGEDAFMLWQNANTIVIGKNQNVYDEINAEAVRARGVRVVRRLTGGGAVYHDLGNLNFTFITDESKKTDFSFFIEPIISALKALGVEAEQSGRNDILIDGKKFSGNSQMTRRGRILHHGTLLYNSDLSVVSEVLNPDPEKFMRKGVRSVRSRVVNIAEYLNPAPPIDTFRAHLTACIGARTPLETLSDPAVFETAERLKKLRYDSPQWVYREAVPLNFTRSRRFDFGKVTLRCNLDDERITSAQITGDFFSRRPVEELASQIEGLSREEVGRCFSDAQIDAYITGMTAADFTGLVGK